MYLDSLIKIHWTQIRGALNPQEYLSQEELERFQEITFPLRREQFLAGRVLAKKILMEELDLEVSFQEISFINSADHLEPRFYVRGEPLENYFCSISHKDSWVAVIFSNLKGVGIDIEFIKELSPKVHEYMQSESETLTHNSVQVWTVKEACLKALGLQLNRSNMQTLSLNESEQKISEHPLYFQSREIGEYLLSWVIPTKFQLEPIQVNLY